MSAAATAQHQGKPGDEGIFRGVFERAPIGMALLALDAGKAGRFLQVNAALCEVCGHSREELLRTGLPGITHPDDLEQQRQFISDLASRGTGSVQVEVRLVRPHRESVWCLLNGAGLGDGAAESCIVQVQDVTERIQLESHLQHLADHDPLTGLLNRRRFAAELTRQLAYSSRYGEAGGVVLLLDLDNFKYVNDAFGHSAGDEVLAGVAGALSTRLRATDVLGRLGGDEFAIIAPGVDVPEAQELASDLTALIASSASLPGAAAATLTTSIGIAPFGGARETAGDLMVEADIALYEAKDTGRDRAVVYDHDRDRRRHLRTRLTWSERIRACLEHDLFVLRCQPIQDLRTGRADHYELLLRMPSEDGELLAPATFLYTAARFGLSSAVDRWVLSRALDLLADREHVDGAVCLHVNLAGESVTGDDLPRFLEEQLPARSIEPSRIVLEVTETAAIANMNDTREFIGRIRALGCGFALDDFGAGFASFYYLKHLPFDYLKIDGEFVRNLTASATDKLLVRSIVQIAHGLGQRTVAEFVADGPTEALLRELGVDYAQGYHLGRPVPISQLPSPTVTST